MVHNLLLCAYPVQLHLQRPGVGDVPQPRISICMIPGILNLADGI